MTERYLGVIQEYVPVVLHDDYSTKAARKQCRDAEVYPRSRYSLTFKNPAQNPIDGRFRVWLPGIWSFS